MDIHDYLGVLRRGIVLIVVGVLLGLAGGYVAQGMEKPTYSATSRELLTNKTAGDLSISQGRIASYVLVASSGLVLQPVIDDLKLDTTVDDLAKRIAIVSPPNTLVIEITATASTAAEAQAIANSVSDHFADVVASQLETTTGALPTGATPGPGDPTPKPSPSVTKLPNGTVVPVTKPTAPVRVVNLEQAALPEAPNPSNGPLLLLVGGVLGLALGLLAASLREAVDRRVRSPRDVAQVTDIPVIGAIVADRRLRAGLTARAGARSASSESFRALRAHVDHLRGRDGRRMFVLTAAGRGQGATTVAANLAVAIANTGTSVVVVDADLRRPRLSELFEVDGARGLSDLLAGRVELDAVLRTAGNHLAVLPSGPVAPNAGELLAMSRMRAVLIELAERYEVVLIDTPTVSDVSDAAVLGALAGSTLLIVQQGASTRPRLDDALALLEAGGSEPAGIVLTRSRRAIAGRAPVTAARPAPVAAAPLPLSPAPAVGVPVAAAPDVAPAPAAAPVLEIAAAPVAAPVAAEPTPAPAGPPSTALAVAKREEPSHLASPLSASTTPVKPAPRTPSRRATAPASRPSPEPKPAAAPATSATSPAAASGTPRTPRRVTQPVMAAPVPDLAAPAAPASKPKPKAVPAPKAEKPTPAPVTSDLVTEVEHTIGTARELDSAFAALPSATAAEQLAGKVIADLESSKPTMIERPIVVKPDAPRPASRFAPDPTRFASSAYASAPAPKAGTQGTVPEVKGTVVNTVSIRVQRDVIESATVPPPIRHILPKPGSTIPPKVLEAARATEPEPELVELRPRTGPVPVPMHEPLPMTEPVQLREPVDVADDDPTAETRAIPLAGSLLGEIGGLPRVEVRAARPAAVTDTAPNPERDARENYEQRARELERVAHERLMREQRRLAVDIREQLAHDKRELESVLDNRLEDTVLRPRDLDLD